MTRYMDPSNFEMLEQRLLMSANDAFAEAAPDVFDATNGFGEITASDDSGSTLESARLISLNSRGAGRLVGRINYTQDIDLLRIDATQTGTMQAVIEIDEENPDLSCTLAVMTGSGNSVNFERRQENGTSVLDFQVQRGESYLICIFGDGQHIGRYSVNVATLEKVNTAPEAANDNVVINEDSAAFNINALANDTDADGDDILLEGYTQASNGMVVWNADGSFNYIPDANFNGSDSFSYTVSDTNGAKSTATVNITVNAVNDTPVADDDAAVTSEDNSVEIDPLANDSDIDGDELSVISVSDPAHGTAVINDEGTITYTPDADFHGTDSFSYSVTDASGAAANATVNITIDAVNDAPSVTDASVNVNEDSSVDITAAASDVDGDELTITNFTQATHGSVVDNGDGSFTYTPDANFNGTDSFTYTVSDTSGATATATVSLSVAAVNDSPVAVDASVNVNEDSSLDITADASDIDGDELTIVSLSQGAHGAVVDNGDGSFTYTPESNFSGADSFSYTVSDASGATATATVNITVAAVNDAPTLADQSLSVNEDSSLSIVVAGQDIDGDELAIAEITQPAHGEVVINDDQSLSYIPDANYNGADSFTCTITDTSGASATATISINVISVNDAPVAQDATAIVSEDGSVVINCQTSDIDGDSLSIISVSQGAHGIVAINGDGTLSYTPAANFHGTDSFEFTVSDGNGASDTASVNVTVTPVNDAPTVSDVAVTIDEDSPAVITINASDIDGDSVTVIAAAAAASGAVVVNGDGTLSYTPDANFHGTDSFEFTVSDGNGATASASVYITVSSVNDSPTASDRSVVVGEDASVVISALGEDVDGDLLSVSEISQPASGSVVDNGDGTLSYTPDANFNGTDSFSYTLSDGNGGYVTANVSVSVAAVNDSPTANDIATSLEEDSYIVIAADASDIDGDYLTVVSVGDAAHGSVSINAAGKIIYVPVLDFYGADSFTYTVSDDSGATATATVTLVVSSVNDVPVVQDSAFNIGEDSPTTFNIIATDYDGDELMVINITTSENGQAVDNGNGTITYTPAANFTGSDSISYTVSDGNGGTATATVSFQVWASNDVPQVTDKNLTVAEDGSIVITDLGTDPDGDLLVVSVLTQGSHGSVVDNGDGTLRYTPDSDFAGTDSFTYTLRDGGGASATATVNITVSALNDAPVANDVAAAVAEDSSVEILIDASDVDADVLSVTAFTQTTHGTLVDNADGSFSYTPDANYNGSDSFTYTVSDGNGGTATATVSINVTAVNDAPTTSDASVTVAEDASVNVAVIGSDIDGDTLSVADFTQASHGAVVDNGNGSFTYTPDANYNGSDSFSYTIADGHGGTATATVSINVTAVNDAPTTSDASVTVAEDASVNVAVIGSDIDGDTLSVADFTQAAHGAVVDNGNGSFTYTPDANYNGSDSFTYTVSDGNGGTATATVSINVTAVNDAPTTSDASVTVAEDASVNIAVIGSDIDGDALSVADFTQAAHGSVVDNGNGSFTYTPDANYNGSDSFSYTIADGHGGTATATVSINVTAVNDAPTAEGRSVVVSEDASVNVAVIGSDIDGDTLSVSDFTQAAHGMVVDNGNGSFTYTPDANYNGSDSFTYTVSDGNGGTATATVSINVTAVNDAPTTSDASVTVAEDASVNVAVIGSDIDGDSLSIASFTQAAHGAVVDNGNGSFTYTPDANYNGSDSFTYTIADGNGGTATATVSINVTAVNDAPTTSDASVTVAEDASVNVAVIGNDIDGDAISVADFTQASHGAVVDNGNGSFTYTPDANYNGSDSFTYTITDGNGGTATATVSINVTAVNDAPTVSDHAYTINEDTAKLINILAQDIDGDVLSVLSITGAAHGVVSDNGNGTLTYTADSDYSGTDSFSYTVTDGNGGTAESTVTMTIDAVNDAPVVSDRAVSLSEDSFIVLEDFGEDVDGDDLDVSASAAAHGSVVVDANGTITYTPDANFYGSDSFSVTVSDGHGGSDSATVSLTVAAVNDAPTTSDANVTVVEDGNVNVAVIGSDIDGDTLSVADFTQAAHGAVVDNGNGSFTYTPDANYNGSDSFTYTISDGNGGTATATVSINVTAVNDAPTTSDANVTVSEDGSVNVAVIASDIDGDTLSVADFTQAAHGSVVDNGNGSFTYTPDANYNGSDSFSYTIADGNGGTATATVSINVTAVNDAPTAEGRSVVVSEDGTIVLDSLASDIDGDTLSFVITSAANHGSAVVNANGTITYAPEANFYGADRFTYSATDTSGATVTATITIAVASVNDDPTANNLSVELDQDASAVIDIVAAGSDIDGDSLEILSISTPANGSVVNNGNGTVSYSPDSGYYGSDSFTFVLSDGRGGEVTASVTLTINEVDTGDDDFVIESGVVVQATAITTADGLTLIVCGTDADDTIVIDQLESGLMMYVGSDGQFFEGDFAAVAIYGFDGADWMRVSSTTTVAAFVYGGSGSDQLFHNGLGNATLDGGSGDDLLVSIGMSEDSLTGGEGLDSFWSDSVDIIGDVSADEQAAKAVHSLDEFYQPYSDDVNNDQYVSKTIAGQNFTDPLLTSTANGYTSFVDAPLFYNDPSYDDIVQGQLGDCYYLASLATYAEQNPEVLRQAITPLGDGTYAVRFFNYDGEEVIYRMDADLPTKNGSLIYARAADGGEIWVAMMEKAYAYYRYNGRSYGSIESGWMTTVYKDLTGEDAEMLWSAVKSDADLHAYLIDHLDAGLAVTAGSQYSDMGPIVGGHAYAILEAYTADGQMYVTVYNPWGIDGRGGDSDGRITLTIAQLKTYFQQFSMEIL